MPVTAPAAFDLVRLLKTVLHPRAGERVGIFIDLDRPADLAGNRYLSQPGLLPQRIAHDVFFLGLEQRKAELPFGSVEMYAYVPTGGSNLDLPADVTDATGQVQPLETILRRLDIVLYMTRYSATAPITALAKRIGFRGCTMHGCNEIILGSGLARDYDQVSARAERFRQAVTRADDVVIEFTLLGRSHRLTLELTRQEAQKSHGLCREPGEIANLPAGEIYWVPTTARGEFPHRFEDGTLAVMKVSGGSVREVSLVRGTPATVDAYRARLASDPAIGVLGELGLGTQELPVSGSDIQDEKALGTFHVATGRSDHLGGPLGPGGFREKRNATHEDILFAPHKTPEIGVNGVWLHKDGREELLLRDYRPTEFVKSVAL